MIPAGSVSEHDLLGGRLALDFANTVEPRTGRGQRDFLPDYGSLADWSAHSGAVTADEAASIAQAASEDAERSAAVWRRVIATREVLYRIFLALAEGRAPLPADLAALSRAVAHAQRHATLTADRGVIRWAWDSPVDVERPLWEVVTSAAEILTSPDASRLGACRHGTDGCGWVFLDATKNGSRRWCGMADCGARAKARRLTERRREARSQAELARTRRSAATRTREPETP